MTLNEKQSALIEEFSYIEDPHERLSLVADKAKTQPVWNAQERADTLRVKGCVSPVWLSGAINGGLCRFSADADSAMVRSLVLFLCDFYSGYPPSEVAASTTDPLEALGLDRHLSPTRRNGLNAVKAAIKAYAQHQG